MICFSYLINHPYVYNVRNFGAFPDPWDQQKCVQKLGTDLGQSKLLIRKITNRLVLIKTNAIMNIY